MKKIVHEREFTRVAARIETEARIASGEIIITGQTRDVSMKSIYIPCDRQIPVGTECEVRLVIGRIEDPVCIEAKGKIVRSDPDGVAIEFIEMDLDSYNHIHNLVLYNSTGLNPDQIERERKNHLGLKRHG